VETKKTQLSLKPKLSLFDATAINIGAIIGAGIFVVTGIVAGLAGSAMIISLLLAAVLSLFTALSFSELSAKLPEEGGAYEFAYKLVSPFSGFIAGWIWIISNIFIGPAVALSFAHYLAAIFPGLPIRPVAVAMTVIFTLLNIVGVKSSATVNNVLVSAKILILLFFIGLGAMHINQANLKPFTPFEPGVLYGAYFIFFAFSGFARVTLLAEEVQDARKNIPRAIMLSLLISTVIYLAVAFIAIALVGAGSLGSSASPLSDAISAAGSVIASLIISTGGLIATASVLLTTILGVSRLGFAMAEQRDLPPVLARLHPKFDTPYLAIVASSVLMIILIFVSNLSQIVAVGTLASLTYYGIGNFSALKLKMDDRRYSRIIPLLGIISCAAFAIIVVFKTPEAWVIGIAIFIAGTIYYRYGRRKIRGHLQIRK
jgi:APA family basic amino acid/polyamine antiporter